MSCINMRRCPTIRLYSHQDKPQSKPLYHHHYFASTEPLYSSSSRLFETLSTSSIISHKQSIKMPFTMVTCDACSQLVEHSCYNSGLEYEKSKSHFGSHIYKFSINSFPSDCDPHSLVSLAWSKMPGNSYGNTNVCDHAKYVIFSMQSKR